MTMQQNETGQIAVLIVDDKETTRRQLARLLQRTGEFQVDMAASGEDAIAQVQHARGNYDAVVMDQELGGMTGIETMRRLRANYPYLQVLMFTGQEPEAGIEALRQGAYRYILKGPSFFSDELVMTVKAMAEARRQQVRARETHWVQALLRIAQNATSLPLDQLVTEVACSARGLLSGVTSILWLSDPKSRQLRVMGLDGSLKERYRDTLRIDLGAEPTRRFIQKRRPIYLPDVTDPAKAHFYTDEHRKIAQEHGWVSLLSAPMVAEEQVVGILDVYTAERRTFTAEDRDLLQAFAEQAALALQKAMEVNERRQLLERLRTVSALPHSSELIGQVGGSSDLRPILQQVASSTGELAGADYVVIYPYDPFRSLLYDVKNVVLWGQRKPSFSLSEKPRQRGIAAITRTVEELVVYDVEQRIVSEETQQRLIACGLYDEFVSELLPKVKFLQREDIESFVGLSLRAGRMSGHREEVGVMYIDFRYPRKFNSEQLDAIRIHANHAASAILNARLLQRERIQTTVVRTISANLGLRKVAQEVLDQLKEIVDYRKASVQLIESDSRRMIARRGFNRVDKWLLRPLSEDSLAARVVEDQQPVVLSDLSDPSKHPDWEVRPDTKDIRSWIGLPLVYGGETQCLITLDHTTRGFYSEVVTDQLMIFADQAAIAIYNARLHETLKELVDGGQAFAKASLNLRDTLKVVAKTAKRVVGCDIAIVHPIDERTNELRLDLATMAGARGARSTTKKPRISGNTQRILSEGRLIVEDTADTERYPFLNLSPDSFLNRVGVRSFLGIRMKVGELAKGALYFDYQLPHHFTTDELEVAQLLANQAAIAIDNAQRYEQKIRDTQMLAALQEVNSAIASSSLVDVATLIAEKAKQLAHASFGGVWALDQDHQHLKVLAYSGPRPRSLNIPVHDSINGYVVTTREPIVINNLPEDLRFHKEYHDFVSCMAVPLMVDTQITGTLYIKAKQQDAFTQQDLALLEALADQASIAIRNAEVFEQRRKDLQALQEINEVVVSKSIAEVLQLVVDKALDVLPGEHSTLWLLEVDTGDLVLASEAGEQLAASHAGGRIKKGERSINMQIASSGMAHITEDADGEPDFLRLYQAAQSAVTVPLKYQGVVIGTLNVESSRKRSYTNEHLKLLDTFGDQAAIAIDNARKYAKLEVINSELEATNTKLHVANSELGDRLKELEAIKDLQHEISRLVPSSEQLDLIYAATAKAMAGLMDIRNMYIALYDRRTDTVEFALRYENGEPVQQEKSYLQPRKLGERQGLTDWIIDHKQPLLVAGDFKAEALALGIQPFRDLPTRCWLGAPMLLGGEVIGVIGLNHFESNDAYDEHHRDLLMTIAGQAAIAIANARQYERRRAELAAVGKFQQSIIEIEPATG